MDMIEKLEDWIAHLTDLKSGKMEVTIDDLIEDMETERNKIEWDMDDTV